MKPAFKFIELPNQLRLPYLEQGDPSGVPLILLHGIADSAVAFELLLPYLPETIRAIALTQRGHGDASRPESGYFTADFTADLLMFMNALHMEKAVILGASSGGFTARRFAIQHPQRISGLVLLGSPAELREKPSIEEAWSEVFSRLKDPMDPEFVRGFALSLLSKPIPAEFLEKMIHENLKLPARVWQETFKGIIAETFPGDLDKINTPTLIIWGEQDTVLSRQEQEALINTIKGSRLVVHPNAGHMLYWEEPESVADDIAAFVAAIT